MAAPRNPSIADAIATRTASRRISFAKIAEPMQAPDLLGLQTNSFDWLLGNERWRARVEEAAKRQQALISAPVQFLSSGRLFF